MLIEQKRNENADSKDNKNSKDRVKPEIVETKTETKAEEKIQVDFDAELGIEPPPDMMCGNCRVNLAVRECSWCNALSCKDCSHKAKSVKLGWEEARVLCSNCFKSFKQTGFNHSLIHAMRLC